MSDGGSEQPATTTGSDTGTDADADVETADADDSGDPGDDARYDPIGEIASIYEPYRVTGDNGDVLLTPLADDEREAFRAYVDNLPTRPADEIGPAYDYQRAKYGDTEIRASPDELLPHATWADGANFERGMLGDAKYVADGEQSFFIPSTMSPYMELIAQQKMDDRLAKYGAVIDDPDSPVRGLEITTNHPAAADFIADRMDGLNIAGVVLLED